MHVQFIDYRLAKLSAGLQSLPRGTTYHRRRSTNLNHKILPAPRCDDPAFVELLEDLKVRAAGAHHGEMLFVEAVYLPGGQGNMSQPGEMPEFR